MEIKIGDVVGINDGSYAVRLDRYEERSCIGLSRDKFVVIRYSYSGLKCGSSNIDVHDIHIKNTRTGEIFLHSSSFVEKVDMKCEWRKDVTTNKTILGYKEWLMVQP